MDLARKITQVRRWHLVTRRLPGEIQGNRSSVVRA
jgi:hypothetical protein